MQTYMACIQRSGHLTETSPIFEMLLMTDVLAARQLAG